MTSSSDSHGAFGERVAWFVRRQPQLMAQAARRHGAHCDTLLLSFVDPDRLRRLLHRMLDEDEFLSPYGVRSVSRRHAAQPYTIEVDGEAHTIDYEPEFVELPTGYTVQNLPLAVERRRDSPELVHWTGTDTVLGPLADGHQDREPFILKEQHRCTRLVPSRDGSRIEFAEIQNLMEWKTLHVRANTYVVCCNAYLTPQVLWNSGIRPEPLGRYLTEQPMAFCQVVLRQDIVDRIQSDPRFADRVRQHREENPHAPVPIPTRDPEPQVWIPVSDGRPWHCQIHRDAFHYGDVAPNVDTRLVVDLRWFGIVEPRYEARITFSDRHLDAFGMPQPTFDSVLNDEDRRQPHRMMADMLRAANALGGFMPGSEPQFVAPGLPVHVTGTTRMGTSPDDSVVDANSRVWGIENLYLGGNGLIPRGSASNPTLTSVAMALKAAEHINGQRGR